MEFHILWSHSHIGYSREAVDAVLIALSKPELYARQHCLPFNDYHVVGTLPERIIGILMDEGLMPPWVLPCMFNLVLGMTFHPLVLICYMQLS